MKATLFLTCMLGLMAASTSGCYRSVKEKVVEPQREVIIERERRPTESITTTETEVDEPGSFQRETRRTKRTITN